MVPILRPALIVAPALAALVVGLAIQSQAPSPADPEAAAIAGSGGLVSRQGPALHFHMKGGAELVLTDRLVCGDVPCPAMVAARYRYQGWDARTGGFRLAVGAGQLDIGQSGAMILRWEPEAANATLEDAEHAVAREGGPLAQPAPPPAAAPDSSFEDWLKETAGARDQVEAPFVGQSNGAALRQHDVLTLGLAQGKLVLLDDLVCGSFICPASVVRAFEYRGASPDKRYLAVAEHRYEGGDALLIDVQSGAVTRIAGPPVFSADGKYAVAVPADSESPGQGGLQLWSLAAATPALAFAANGDSYEIVDWADPDHLRLRRGVASSAPRAALMLAHEPGGWRLEGGE